MRVFAFWVAKGKGVVNGTRNPRVLGSYVYPSYYLYVSTPRVPKLPCCSNQLVVADGGSVRSFLGPVGLISPRVPQRSDFFHLRQHAESESQTRSIISRVFV